MGILFMKFGSKRSRLLLSSSNLIGRHWRCDTAISNKSVPLYWVEVRWFDTHWGWRSLTAAEQTRGAGARMENGWRKWGKGKISLGDTITLELTDSSPPKICFEHLETKERTTVLDMNGRVFVRGNTVFCSSDDEIPYVDGSIIDIEGVFYRVHIPKPWASSQSTELDIDHERLQLDIDLESLKATFTQGRVDCNIYGEPVRLLYVFAQLKKQYSCQYFSSEEIFTYWCTHGGTESSPLERMNWERAKIKNLLSAKQVANVGLLFLRKKEKRKWFFQLGVDANNITIL